MMFTLYFIKSSISKKKIYNYFSKIIIIVILVIMIIIVIIVTSFQNKKEIWLKLFGNWEAFQ